MQFEPRIPHLASRGTLEPQGNQLCLSVYRGAPNRDLEWSTIQAAVNSAELQLSTAFDTATITVRFPIGTGEPWVWDPTITITKPGIVIMAAPGSSFYGTNCTLVSNIIISAPPVANQFINPISLTGFRLAPADKTLPAIDITYLGQYQGPPLAVALTNTFIIDDVSFSGGFTGPALIRGNSIGVLISMIRSLLYTTTPGALPVLAADYTSFDANGSRFIYTGGPLLRYTASFPSPIPFARQALNIAPCSVTLLNSIIDSSGTVYGYSGQASSILDIQADSNNVTIENCQMSIGLADQVNTGIRIDPAVNNLVLRLMSSYLFLSGQGGSLVIDAPAKPNVVIVGSLSVDPDGVTASTPGLTTAALVSVP